MPLSQADLGDAIEVTKCMSIGSCGIWREARPIALTTSVLQVLDWPGLDPSYVHLRSMNQQIRVGVSSAARLSDQASR
jgi:hypothetical protein